MRAVATALVLAAVLDSCATPPPVRTTLSRLERLQLATDSGLELPRPSLPTGADTNAAASYYRRGETMVKFGVKFDTAEMALYWASRLDPAWPDPIYARGLLVLRAAQQDAFETWLATRSLGATRRVALTPRQIQLVDSLMHVAWMRNPFLYMDLEFTLLPPARPGDELRAAWSAYATRRFSSAESLFARALRKHPEDIGLRIYRAKALFYLQRYDHAVAELAAARDSVRGRAEARVSLVLPSIEMFEYGIGIARVQQDDFPAARAAFQRALTENLGLYWAHARLAGAALALGDTATALTELQLAVDVEARDPVLRLYYGVVLHAAGRLVEAATQLQRAIELDPYYAALHYRLGAVYAGQGKVQGAIEQYRQFTARAAQADPDRARADRALAALGAASPVPTVVDSGHVPRHF
jgi:tetratricopeptide (TPR) repeat protein